MSDLETLFPSSGLKRLAQTQEELETLATRRVLGDEDVVWLLDPSNPTRSMFVAPDPAAALRWICRAAVQKPLLDSVRALTKRPRDEDGANEDGTNGPSSNSRVTKQARGTSSNTRRAEQRRQQEAKQVYRDIWHNSQEAERNALEEDAFNLERASWLRFAGQQSEAKSVGTVAMAEAIRRATTVGNSDALRELQLSLQHWRAQYADSQAPPASQRPSQGLIWPSEQGRRNERSRYHYRHLQQCEQLGARSSIERRYSAARLREDYESRLGSTSQAVTTHARQQIQAQFFVELEPAGEATRSNPHFLWFQRTLKHGKRWLSLEKAFGCGIFALLPSTRIPNTYIERTLTDELFTMWIRLIMNQSPLVKVMSSHISNLVQRLAEDMAPPSGRLCLEGIEVELPTEKHPTEELAALLEPFDTQGRVQDVTGLEDEVAPRCRLHSRDWSRSISIPDSEEEENADGATEEDT